MFLGTHRPFSATINDAAGNPQLQILRPFFFFLSEMFVQTNLGAQVGSIHRRFNILQATYSLRDNRGREFATIKRPFWRFWLFDIKNLKNQTIGHINKRWGGVLREMFSSADSFEVSIKNANFSDFQRALVLGASIAIDFDHFEKQSKN